MKYTSSGLLIFLLLLISFRSWSQSPDWTKYHQILKQVKQGFKHNVSLTLVDYAHLKKSGELESVYRTIEQFPVKTLSSPEEKLAFYINVYNILALKMVLDHWPLTSIKDVGHLFSPVWGRTAGSIGGKAVSLDDIENKIIRPMNDPRIHLAIVCASVSCPDLRREPYIAENLNAQLDDQAKTFFHNDRKGLQVDQKFIHISKIFDWFEKDFTQVGGVTMFIRNYRPDLPLLDIKADIDYDWAVNGIR